jgi:hypothetical protein
MNPPAISGPEYDLSTRRVAFVKDAQKPDHISLNTLISRLKEGRFVVCIQVPPFLAG